MAGGNTPARRKRQSVVTEMDNIFATYLGQMTESFCISLAP